MKKAINFIILLLCGLSVFAVLGSFCDALTSHEAVEILGSCLVALAVLSKLPEHKIN